MKRIYLLAVAAVTLSLILSGCGTSDYVQSVTLSATSASSTASSSSGSSSQTFFNLAGIDGTLQLVVMANYHSGKSVDVTNSVTYNVTPTGTDASGAALPAYGPTTVPINKTGLMTAEVPLCTWIDVASGSPPVIPTPPKYNWEYTGYYQTVAVYNGMQSQPVAVGVGSAAGNAPDGTCGPQ